MGTNSLVPQGSYDNVAGAVPSGEAQHQTASAGTDIVSSILGQQRAIQAEINNTIPQALTPVAQSGHTTPYMKGAFSFSVTPPKMPPAQGSSDAKKKGIASTIAGVGNIVGSILKVKKEEQQRDLAHDIERVMGAQDQIGEAQEILKTDPNNKEANDVLKKSQQLIKDTLDGADKKKLKQFEKAFKLDPIDPSKNNGDEHQALKMAAQSYTKQLESSKMDTKLVPNTQAIAKVGALKEQYKDNQEALKTIVPLVETQTKEEGLNKRAAEHEANVSANVAASNASKEKIEKERAEAQIKDTKQRGKDLIAAAATRGSYAVKAATVQANERYDQAMDSITEKSKLLSKVTDPVKRAAINKQTAAGLIKLQQTLPATIYQNEQLLSNAPKHGFPGFRKPDDPDNYKLMTDLIQHQKEQMADVNHRIDVYNKTGEFPTDTVVDQAGEGKSQNNDQRAGSSAPVPIDPVPDDYSNSNNPIYDAPK